MSTPEALAVIAGAWITMGVSFGLGIFVGRRTR